MCGSWGSPSERRLCLFIRYRERKCADTIGTVPVPCDGHVPMLKYKYVFEIKYAEAILSNSPRKLLWFETTKMLIAVQEKKTYCVIYYNFRHSLIPYARLTGRTYVAKSAMSACDADK